ncbi:MAG TPA: ribosome maturation factor RimM [Burkholderiales bacterium]|nr:ribosome maturation factor RimM [Burkholderiales bacterium]
MSEDFVVLGRVTGPYGVKGWIKIQPYTEDVERLCEYKAWWVGGQQKAVMEAAVHSASVIAQVAGVESREAAAALKGAEIAVPREALPEVSEDEFYWADLIGLEVVNEQEEVLGKVAGHMSNGAHDVMRVMDGETERLLPFVDAVIRKVDMAARRIRVDWGADW